jgi:uncharacterized protein (DUF983 family)
LRLAGEGRNTGLMKLRGIITGLCPRCLQGQMFLPGIKGVIGLMNDRCAVCGLPFLREAGYYLGAMYVSYALGVFTILPVTIVTAVVLGWELSIALTIMVLQTIISMPLFLRYSRTLWLYVDQAVDPQ